MQQTIDSPTDRDLKRGWRELDSGDANVPNTYECLRGHEAGDGYCSETFASRRALGSHQGRGHTRKAKAGAKAAERDELATAIGRAVLTGEVDIELERQILERIRDIAGDLGGTERGEEILALATFLRTHLGGGAK